MSGEHYNPFDGMGIDDCAFSQYFEDGSKVWEAAGR